MKNYNGIFLAFEGIECSGKSTQIKLLSKTLIKKFGTNKIVITKEPGAKIKINQLIRKYLLYSKHSKKTILNFFELIKSSLPTSTNQLQEFIKDYLCIPEKKINWEIINTALFIFDRAIHIEKIIKPALVKNKIVISDRFDGSTIAYQGVKLKKDLNWKKLLLFNTQAKQNIEPNKYILIDITVKESIKRLKLYRNGMTNFEKRSAKYFENVRNEFLKQTMINPDLWIKINGMQSIETIHQEILNVLFSVFRKNLI